MTDRELLERAARAAGLDVEWTAGEPFLGEQIWNPFKSDADAFRLMVRLDMTVEAQGDAGVAIAMDEFHEMLAREPHADDPVAATRRAIVRAAAEMTPD